MSTLTLSEGVHLLNLARQKGLGSDGHTKLIQTGLLADLFEAADELQSVDRDEFRLVIGLLPINLEITVNHCEPFEVMISAGNYDWVNENIIAEKFPHREEGTHTLKPDLVHLDRKVGTDEVLALLKKRKRRPANCAELLAFGATYPEIQRKFPVVALGQSAQVDSGQCVPCLRGSVRWRKLDLGWVDCGWCAGYRFLAFEL